jgi:hypothetical protein
MSVIWRINGTPVGDLGLSGLSLAPAAFDSDKLTFTHDGAAWDSAAIFAYGQTLTLTRQDGAAAPVVAFIGKVRRRPRFIGTQAQSLKYEVLGPWDWLQRRPLIQNQAVVVDPEASLVPTMLPQGLAILGQSDAGTSVQLSAALAAVLAGAPAAGVAFSIGAGFDYGIAWDEVADLNIADAVIRLLATAYDATSWIDYTTTPLPTLHIARRANLASVTIKVAPDGEGWDAPYTPLESVTVDERHDLVPSGVTIHFRRIDTVNGRPYLRIITQSASDNLGYQPTDENALVRTIELAGSSYTETVLEQPIRVTPLSVYLTEGGTITSGDAFAALSRFWKRSVAWLNDAGVEIKGFRATGRVKTDMDSEEFLDLTLNQDLLEGDITEWMESGALNRKGQGQTFRCEIAVEVTTEEGTTMRKELLTADVMACNCATRTYRFTESTEATPAEPTPEGMATAIYTALKVPPIDGGCMLIEEECTLTLRPGLVVNLQGGLPEWETMRAMIQRTTANLDEGTTEVVYGPPRQLGPDDLVQILRANRFKTASSRGLVRATGKL